MWGKVFGYSLTDSALAQQLVEEYVHEVRQDWFLQRPNLATVQFTITD